MDSSEVPLADLSRRLEALGVDHVAHSTWSHGKPGKEGHSHRVFVDLVADAWPALEGATRELFELAGLEPTPESWASPCFFVPAVDPARRGDYRFARSLGDPRPWRPTGRLEPNPAALATPARLADEPAEDLDVEELRSALAAIDNAPRDRWIEVGMALHSTGLEEARELWDEWSAGEGAGGRRAAPAPYDGYDDEAQEAAWASFGGQEGVTAATIFHHAREAGWRPAGGPRRATAAEDFAALLSPRARVLRGLNRRYAYVPMGQGRVVDLGDPDGRAELAWLSTRAFVALHAHPKLPHGEPRKDGTRPTVSAGDLWLSHWPGRRTYERVDFLPPGGPDRLPKGTLNLWRGWGVDPGPGSCDRILEHAREVICDGRVDLYRWLVAWMAHLVQRPWEKPGTALVMRGAEGTGKGAMATALVDLTGAHGLHVTNPRHLLGNFNALLASKLVIFADEVTWGGRKQEEGVLKATITERATILEPKGVDPFSARSFCRLVVSSNEEWAVPAGRTARRLQVLDVSEKRAGDDAYFEALWGEIRGGGLAALHRRLLAVDLEAESTPDPRRVIATSGLVDQKVESLDSIDRWLLEALREGRLAEHHSGWPAPGKTFRTADGRSTEGEVPTAEVYESYLAHARRAGAHHRADERAVGIRLGRVFGRGSGGYERRRVQVDGRRSYRSFFPPRRDAREAFARWLRSDPADLFD